MKGKMVIKHVENISRDVISLILHIYSASLTEQLSITQATLSISDLF